MVQFQGSEMSPQLFKDFMDSFLVLLKEMRM